MKLILMNHVYSQPAEAWASKRGLGRMKHVMLKYMYVQDAVEKIDVSCIHLHEAEQQSRFDDKLSHIRSTQERLCGDKIETRLKQNREVKEQREDETKRGKREKRSISSDEEGMNMKTNEEV